MSYNIEEIADHADYCIQQSTKALGILSRHLCVEFEKQWNLHNDLSIGYERINLKDVESCVSVLSPNNVKRLMTVIEKTMHRDGFVFRLTIEDTIKGHFPPIVEHTQGKLIILDGAHRLFAVDTFHIPFANMIVLSSSNQPIPCCKTYGLQFINEREVSQRKHEIIFNGIDESLFRPVRRILYKVRRSIEKEYRNGY